MRKRVIGYCRVSSMGQAVDGISLEAQKAKIQQWAEYQGHPLHAIFCDEGASGKKASNRPGLQQALSEIEEGDVLVFYSLSRLARSIKDTLIISEHVNRRNAHFVSLSENIDTTSAAGKMIFHMLAVLAEFESLQISERTCFALQYKRGQGRKTGGHVPFGYDCLDGKLIENEEEQGVIRRIVKLRKKGLSTHRIATALNSESYRTKLDKEWAAGQVHVILKRVG